MAKKKCKYEYHPYQQDVILLKGIADVEPYHLRLPDAPPIETFINYGLPPEKQFFQREEIPEKLRQIDRSVKKGQLSREDAVTKIEQDEELCVVVEKLWLKRLTGDWQLINGHPIHISPTHWFYLNFWPMNIGLPDFRMDFYHYCTDLWFFAWWDYMVVPNPFCEGAIEFAMRQIGKSYKLGVILWEYVSRTYEARAGMQSKTDSDANVWFGKCVVKPWRKLPFFFQPLTSSSSFPKSAIEFLPVAQKGKNAATAIEDNDELMGSVDYASSTVDAYDNATLTRYGDDECGKAVNVDVYERYNRVRPALRTRGGKSYHTSTVEELTKGGGLNFKLMWDDSDRHPTGRANNPPRVDENGETISGLWPWFCPSYCTYQYDQYGFSIVDKITDVQKAYTSEASKHTKVKYHYLTGMEAIDYMIKAQPDPIKKQDIIRKYPRNIREAFESGRSSNYFREDIINKRLEHFSYGYTHIEKPYMEFGNFDWVDGHFLGQVEFVECPKEQARIYRVRLPNEQNWSNRKIIVAGNKYKPANTAMFCGSADTFKYNKKDVLNPSKMSDGAAHVWAFFNPLIDDPNLPESWLTDDFIVEYLARPDTVAEYTEDMLKIALYYGCKIFPEDNLDNVAMFFKDNGCEHYLQVGRNLTVKQDVGIVYQERGRSGFTTLGQTKETMFRVGAEYIKTRGDRCKFYRTLRDFKEVEFDNLNPYDLFVSSTICLINSFDFNNPNKAQHKKDNELDAPKFGINELGKLAGWF